MTLMDYCMQYIGEIMDGKRAAPEGVTLTETDPMRRSLELLQKAGDIPTLVRMCAAQDGTEIPQEVFDSFDPESLTQLAGEGDAAPEEPEQQPDPDAGKHAFQVLLDCVALDDGLVQYLTQVLRDRDWAGFYKLSQITTKMDLDPEEYGGMSGLAGQQGALGRRRGAGLRRGDGRLPGAPAAGGTAGAAGGAAVRRPTYL